MMNMNKWRVERQRKGRWAAYDPVYGHAVHPWTFDTHAEALAHADERSRTIEVTLPAATSRAVFDAGRGHTTYVNWDANGWAWLESDGEIFAITDREREPLALHLLAHHYRKTRA